MSQRQVVVVVYSKPWWYGLNARTGAVVNLARKYGALRAKLARAGHRVLAVRQRG